MVHATQQDRIVPCYACAVATRLKHPLFCRIVPATLRRCTAVVLGVLRTLYTLHDPVAGNSSLKTRRTIGDRIPFTSPTTTTIHEDEHAVAVIRLG